jgi:hypothetical protein
MAVNYTDFDKVWASASPLTPYEFSENQYKEGWNFVGATPPSRQMWDAFMKHADEKLKYLYDHEDIPVGHEYFTMNPNIPQGSLPLLGGEYSRETYSALWTWVQQQTGYLKTEAEWQTLSGSNNGNVPYYSDGDGSTTFRVPSLHCWIKGSDGAVQLVGSYLAAGLPNITGKTDGGVWWFNNGAQEGAVYRYPNGVGAGSAGGVGNWDGFPVGFDASLSNPIYGNANTVQPESIVGMWLVKAYGTIQDTGTINEQQYIDDRTAALRTEIAQANAVSAPVGCVQAFAGSTTPDGWLFCDGSAVSRITYADLYAVIGDTYGDGDGSTTFNLPDLIDKFVQGNATSGTEHSAGLPNVTGKVGSVISTGSDGSFYETTSLVGLTGGSGVGTMETHFDASRSSAIYGNSNTVQPPSVTMRYIIKY